MPETIFKPVDSNPDFPRMEKELLDHWYKDGIVDKYLRKNNRSKKYFSFLDGPITANNPMGVHHAWGRTYKDIWPRFFNLLGYRQRFQNGFDCQGLWVEVEVEKELGLKSKKEIENLIPGDPKASIAKFVQLCKDRVKKYSKIQTDESKRLGYFADWDHSYYTMSDENNYMIWRFLKICYDNGWIYKGRGSVPWCPRCETAISQHEMLTEDYKEVSHDSVILEFNIKNQISNIKNTTQRSKIKEKLLVWTTTPWTIPANIAVAVDVKADYALVEGKISKDTYFWVMKKLVNEVFSKGYQRIVKVVKGRELIGLRYTSPFDNLPAVAKVAKNNRDNFHTVIPTDPLIMPISATEGTGLVHTAVSAGTEDFQLGKKYGLPMIPVIGDNADYLPGLGFLSGKNAKKHPELILNFLKDEDKKGNDCVFDIFPYKHRYPACWRCKTELVWKVEDEWYIAMDKKSSKFKVQSSKINKTLRERMISVAKKINWRPEFGLERELDWLKNMHDWLISKKNRYWGLALPIWECKKCSSFEVVGSRNELKRRAVEGWKEFEGHSPHKPFIDEVKIRCQRCQDKISRVNDVGNPWLDAGIVSYSTITENNQGEPLYLKNKIEWKKWFPADFITESFPGQFKNWFYALIAESTVLENVNPFKTVLGFGTLLGEDGRPMHKSWGNAIEFNEGADKIGVDVMRWMFARQNPSDNMLFGYKKADEVRRQFYLTLWNVYKFFVEYANLDKLKTQSLKLKTATQNSKLINILDRWIMARLFWFINNAKDNFSNYDVQNVALEAEKFVSDLSTWYIRRSRDRVWLNSNNRQDKDNFYITLYSVLINLSIILSPIIPFLAEIIYTNLTGEESVHLSHWPKADKKAINNDLLKEMDYLRQIVEVGHRIRKEKKLKVRQPLAKATISTSFDFDFYPERLNQYMTLLKKELNVKDIKIIKTKTLNNNIRISYDTRLTKQLKLEGEIREVVRQIQDMRKKLGKKPEDKVNLVIPDKFKPLVSDIKNRLMVRKISFGKVLAVK